MRTPRHQMFMDMAHVAARRSTCVRLNVGAIITLQDRPISLGYNGAPAGEPHCAGNACPGMEPGGCPTLHAEANAIDFAEQLRRVVDSDLYVTHSPCQQCADRILRAGIRRVFFCTAYRDDHPLKVLHHANVDIYQVTPAGHLLQWVSGKQLDEPIR